MEAESFVKVSKTLADPQRFAILERIAREPGELACKALVAEFDVSQATISHHLKELSNAGLIEGRREGQCMYLRARRAALEAYHRELGRRVGVSQSGQTSQTAGSSRGSR